MSTYTPGSITSILSTASHKQETPRTSSGKRLKALFEKSPSSEPTKKKVKPGTGAVQRNEQSDIAHPAQKKKKTTDSSSELVIKREEGLRNADRKEKKIKSKRRRKRPVQEDASTAEENDSNKTDTGNTSVEQSNGLNAKQRIESRVRAYVRPKNPELDRKTVFVGNVATTVTKKDLMKFFKSCGKITSVRLRSVPVPSLKLPKRAVAITKDFHPQRHNMNAYIMFENEESTKNAIKLNGVELEGLHIRVDLADSASKHDHKRSVFVGNLSIHVEEEALRDHFRECGAIHNVRIIRDPKTGLGKGIGYVAFEDTSSVDLALLLEGQPLNGRDLRVHRSMVNPPKKSTPAATNNSKQKVSASNSKSIPARPSKPGQTKKFTSSTDSTKKPVNKTPVRGKHWTDTGTSRNKNSNNPGQRRTRQEALDLKRMRKKEIRRKSRELKKQSLGQLLIGKDKTV